MIRSSYSTIHNFREQGISEISIHYNGKYGMHMNQMISIDLPSLQSIYLGTLSLYGENDSSCSLTMRSRNEFNSNDRMQISRIYPISAVQEESALNVLVRLHQKVFGKSSLLILYSRHSQSSKCLFAFFIHGR